MNNFSFEPLKLQLATNNIIIPMENGVANLTNAETSAKIMLGGKELFPDFDDRIGGRNLFLKSHYIGNDTILGLSRTLKDNGQFVIDGTLTASRDVELYAGISIPLMKGEKYTFSIKKINGQTSLAQNIYLSFRSSDGSITLGQYISHILDNGSISFIPNFDGEIYRVRVLGLAGVIFENLTFVIKLEKSNTPTLWTPAPEDVLQFATLSSYNCSAAIVGDLIKITSHKPDTTRGWVDTTVNYGNLSNTKRLNWSVEGVEPYKPLGTLLTMNNRGIKL